MRQLQKGEVEVGMVVSFLLQDGRFQGEITEVFKSSKFKYKSFDMKCSDGDTISFEPTTWEHVDVYLVEDVEITEEVTPQGAIKSDGGSSSYYDIEVPEWLLQTLNQRNGDGKCFIKTEEVNEILGNDFNYATIFKSMVRAISIEHGVGKKGNTHQYECNKVRYYIDRVEEKFSRGKYYDLSSKSL